MSRTMTIDICRLFYQAFLFSRSFQVIKLDEKVFDKKFISLARETKKTYQAQNFQFNEMRQQEK